MAQPSEPTSADAPVVGLAVEHRSRLATGVAVAAAVMTVAWFARALSAGEPLAWVWCAILAMVAVAQLVVVRDSSAPLLLADDHGVRVRDGETWSGLRWPDIDRVEVRSARGLRDGHLVVHPRETDDDQPAVEPLRVPLAVTTRLRYDGLTGDLVADLDSLASGRTPVVVVVGLAPAEDAPLEDGTDAEPELTDSDEQSAEQGAEHGDEPPATVHTEVEVVVLGAPQGDDGPLLPRQLTVEQRDQAEDAEVEAAEAAGAAGSADESTVGPQVVRKDSAAPTVVSGFEPVQPTRETRRAARSHTVHETVRAMVTPVAAQRDAPGGPVVVARVDEFEERRPRPADEPRIGPLVAAARQRARLSIDTLSERTRIRPHVLECIEVDDFEPCGGDFYARGHLRTLARVFGLEAADLVEMYDAHYAHPVIGARQVFEAELATGIGGGMRATSTGPRWSVLAAAAVALGLVWGGAHFLTEQPQEVVSQAPEVDSAGLAHSDTTEAPKSTLAALGVTAVGASPQVVVRDRDGRILWAGKLDQGRHQQVIGLAPFDVTASNGKAVEVSFLGKKKGTVGATSAADSKTFG